MSTTNYCDTRDNIIQRNGNTHVATPISIVARHISAFLFDSDISKRRNQRFLFVKFFLSALKMAGFLAEIKQNVENCDVFYLDTLSYSQQFLAPTKNADKNAKLILMCKLVNIHIIILKRPTRKQKISPYFSRIRGSRTPTHTVLRLKADVRRITF